MIGRDEPARVILYHRCPDFAAGSVFPLQGAAPLYWFARFETGAWRIWIRGVLEIECAYLVERIRDVARLELDAGQAARDAQDARAEAPDL